MDNDLRASLIAACAAIALSALIGLISGVGVAALLLRALACGAGVGLAAYGCIALVRRMLPEMLEPAQVSREPLAEMDEGVGRKVDIVLPGEDAEPQNSMEATEAMERDDLAGEAAENEILDDESLLDGVIGSEQGIVAAMPTQSPAGAPGGSSRHLFDELDILPDLDGFTDSFTASEFASGGSAGTEPVRSSPSPSHGASRDGMDPAALAQAVRTILKRDQKG